jgi:hypothetical protein
MKLFMGGTPMTTLHRFLMKLFMGLAPLSLVETTKTTLHRF